MSRSNRKKDHINTFKACDFTSRGIDYFKHIKLMHNALPELDFDEIDTSSTFLNKKTDYPIMINAITGGIGEVYEINKALAEIAKTFKIPMAVGSQSIALSNEGDKKSFEVVREVMGEGSVIANIGANQSYENALEAVNMIEADAIQLHINVAQEIIMPEGDRAFKGLIEHIASLNDKLPCPVIVKEVGFGISGKVAKKLQEVGIQYIDVSGKGGTNFIEIEDQRNHERNYKEFYDWGIPTPVCIRLCRETVPDMKLIASGGIQNAEHIYKSLCLGVQLVGISGILLNTYLKEGYKATYNLIEDMMHKLKIYMLLTGCRCVEEIKKVSFYWQDNLFEM